MKTHRMTGTNFYKKWVQMIGRVRYNPQYISKGITACPKWQKFIGFKEDMYESYCLNIIENGQKKTTLDRIDNSKGYFKENCRWVDLPTQLRNRAVVRLITINGETKTIPEWSVINKIPIKVAYNRIYDGWPPEQALSFPVISAGYTRTNFKKRRPYSNILSLFPNDSKQ